MNQYKLVKGEIERENDTIFYTFSWVREMPKDVVQMNEIDSVSIIDSNGEQRQDLYEEHRDEIDDLIVEDASKHEPTDWEQPSLREYKECMAEA